MMNKNKPQENAERDKQRRQLAEDIGFLLASQWLFSHDNRMREGKQRIKPKIVDDRHEDDYL